MNFQQQYAPTGFRLLPPVIKNLLIINALFFLATLSLRSAYGIDLTDMLGLHYFGSHKFRIYQLVTYMFMHGGFSHLFFNMFALWMFGNVLEELWGTKRFLVYYFITGVGAALIQMLVNWWQFYHIQEAFLAYAQHPSSDLFANLVHKYFPEYLQQANQNILSYWNSQADNVMFIEQSKTFFSQLIDWKMDIPTVGASGAVFGILLAFGMLFPNSLLYVYFFFPIKAKWFVMIYGAIELYSGIANNAGDNVAHFAHLGGMIFGFFMIKYWNKNRFNRIY